MGKRKDNFVEKTPFSTFFPRNSVDNGEDGGGTMGGRRSSFFSGEKKEGTKKEKP